MNPNIALSVQRPRFDPTEGQRNALAMDQAQMQQAATMMQLQQAQQSAVQSAARRNALSAVDWNSPDSMTQARGVLGGQGDFDAVMAIDDRMSKMTTEKRAAAAAELEAVTKIAPLLTSPETYGQGLGLLHTHAPELATQLPQEFNPQAAEGINRMALGAKGYLDQQNADRTFTETQRHNKETEKTAAQRAANSGPLALISGNDGSMTAIGGPNGIGPNSMDAIANAKGRIKQGEEQGKAVGKYYGDQYGEILKASDQSYIEDSKLNRLDSLLQNVETGKFKGATTEIKKTAKAAGIDLEALGIRDDVAPVEAARALANEMALQLRNPSGGAGMPGAMSDADRVFLQSMVPGIESTPEGRKLVIQSRKQMNQRARDVAKMAIDYRKKYGAVDEGFSQQLQQYSESNPMFHVISAETADQDYSRVPSGAYFMGPDGHVRRKP